MSRNANACSKGYKARGTAKGITVEGWLRGLKEDWLRGVDSVCVPTQRMTPKAFLYERSLMRSPNAVKVPKPASREIRLEDSGVETTSVQLPFCPELAWPKPKSWLPT
jgi:hypothetical protein